MTPAEKMASHLDEVKAIDNLPRDAAALIRRLAAALSDTYNVAPIHMQRRMRERHADALRDVRDIPVEVQA